MTQGESADPGRTGARGPGTGPGKSRPAISDQPMPGVIPGAPDASLPYSANRPPVAIGTAIWLGLLALALVRRDDLVDDGRGWWVWTCVAGVVLGLFGFAYVHRKHVTT